jgi:predicted transcriptional regulator YdeE
MQEAPELTLSSDLTIIGLSVRTRPEAAATDIPALWQRFLAEGVPGKLPACDAYLYALYCDYERDFRAGYTMVLGVAVDAQAPVPEGMRRVRVPAGPYARFAVKGDPAAVVWGAWQHINGEGDGAWRRQGERRYLADFERYVAATLDASPANAEVELCVGLLVRCRGGAAAAG